MKEEVEGDWAGRIDERVRERRSSPIDRKSAVEGWINSWNK